MYEVGDLFVDLRTKNRTLMITEIHIDGLEPVYYTLHDLLYGEDDIWAEYMLKEYVSRRRFSYYAVKQ